MRNILEIYKVEQKFMVVINLYMQINIKILQNVHHSNMKSIKTKRLINN